MRVTRTNVLIVWVASAALAALGYWHVVTRRGLGDPVFVTGYLLLAAIVFLALYNGRKKLSMVPLGRVSTWLTLHLVVGCATIVLFTLHARTLWPLGLADRALALLFYLVTLSGLGGYVLQLWLPGRLTRSGPEVIYERIPAEIAILRDAAERVVTTAAEQAGFDTLGRYYVETLSWYFARPRFQLSHVFGGRRAEFWFRRRLATIRHHLSDAERPALDRLAELGAAKTVVDTQYAMQSVLKAWTLFHVPLAAALLSVGAWHLILVHVYAR
jgi:hypothetical protein